MSTAYGMIVHRVFAFTETLHLLLHLHLPDDGSYIVSFGQNFMYLKTVFHN
jgi:hypothetical protein